MGAPRAARATERALAGAVEGATEAALARDPAAAARSGMAAVVEAVCRAAERRGLADDPSWLQISAVLRDWSGVEGAPGAASVEPDGFAGLGPTTSAVASARPADLAEAGARIDAALDMIAAIFALDPGAVDLLLVAAAADLDVNFAAAYGLLVGADGPRPATVALALELSGRSSLSAAGRAALGAAAPLREWGLVHVDDGAWVLGRRMTVDDSVLGALLGAPVDSGVAAALAVPEPGSEDVRAAVGSAELTAALRAGHRLCWVENPPGGAGAAAARTAFAAADIRCVTVDMALRPAGVTPADAVRHAVRHAALHGAGLLVESAERLARDADGIAGIGLLARSPVPVVMVGSCRWNVTWQRSLPVVVRAAPLTTEDRLVLWRRHVSEADVADAALAAYRLTPEQIDAVAEHAVTQALIAGRAVDPAVVAASLRMLGGSASARSGFGWVPTSFDDLQVPDATRAELERLAAWVRLRDSISARGAVHGLGGKGTGVAALFTGSPGTGKTLAAHVIADTAGLDLMQVDLSGVIDKYIGETEKNLERVFADAENLNVVLFFDEADALFGKRSEVRDAHDRFANQEVSYLLQRMEQFDGITILATNLKGNLDVAFARRLHFIVHFPDPDEPTRRRLWSSLLRQAGDLDSADPVDTARLATGLELCGGDIRNIVLGAVYDAAAEGRPLGMRHLTAAARREYGKLGRRVPDEIS